MGVALIRLGGVNLVFLTVSPNLISTFLVLPDPILYSKSESIIPMALGGLVQDLSKFQMAPTPFLSDLTCSTHSPHDILKLKKMTITCPLLGVSNVTSKFFVGVDVNFLSVFD